MVIKRRKKIGTVIIYLSDPHATLLISVIYNNIYKCINDL